MQQRPVLLTTFAGPSHTAQETELHGNPRNIWLPRIDPSCEEPPAQNGLRDCGL